MCSYLNAFSIATLQSLVYVLSEIVWKGIVNILVEAIEVLVFPNDPTLAQGKETASQHSCTKTNIFICIQWDEDEDIHWSLDWLESVR